MARDISLPYIDLDGGSRGSIQINEYPDKCAICGQGGQPQLIKAHSLGDAWDYDEVVEVVYQCPLNKCNRYYTAIYYKPSRHGDYFCLRNTLAPQYWEAIKFSQEIKNICPRFERIYNQASIAENFGLEEIAGGGYRKALEFLMKDYLIYLKLKTKAEIIKLQLSEAIKLIDDTRIQACTKRASWLGNDEIHYMRKWIDKDIENLKELIRLATNLIENDVIAKKYDKEMPDDKK